MVFFSMKLSYSRLFIAFDFEMKIYSIFFLICFNSNCVVVSFSNAFLNTRFEFEVEMVVFKKLILFRTLEGLMYPPITYQSIILHCSLLERVIMTNTWYISVMVFLNITFHWLQMPLVNIAEDIIHIDHCLNTLFSFCLKYSLDNITFFTITNYFYSIFSIIYRFSDASCCCYHWSTCSPAHCWFCYSPSPH